MASLNRRFGFAALLLPLLFLAMSGLARATMIVVNTTDGESDPFPLCTLPDAITAINNLAPVNGCPAGSFNDQIVIAVTGQINIDETLEIRGPETLEIDGSPLGCSGPGPCGVTIDGEASVQIFKFDPLTTVTLSNLTLADGHATTASPGTIGTGSGGAIFADGTSLTIDECLLRNNSAQGPSSTTGGDGGAIFGNAGDIVIVNSTIANNTAVHGSPGGSAGGAIWATSTMEITASTITGNSADFGGGYFNAPGPSLKGTIWSNNTNSNCDSTNPTDLGFNISDDGSCATFSGTSVSGTNPLLLPLANNGGPTDTFGLETFPSVSPAIGRIPVANCTDQNGFPLVTDQRLFARPDAGDPNFCDSGAYEAGAVMPIVIVPNSEKLAVARSTTANKDMVNTAFTFIYNGDGSCDVGPGGDEDALNSGFLLSIFEGTCASLPANGLKLSLFPFVVHTVNHQSYGTLFQTSMTAALQQSTETVSARMVALPTPAGTCGSWALNLEVAGLNTGALGMPDGNPFALVLEDSGFDASVCFDVNNAIVGSQTPPPPHHVRRRIRRR